MPGVVIAALPKDRHGAHLEPSARGSSSRAAGTAHMPLVFSPRG